MVANGSAKSHAMFVLNMWSLNKLKSLMVLQEFVNYNTMIFKIYIVGKYVKYMKQKSLFDIHKEQDFKASNHFHFIDINYFSRYSKMPSYKTVSTNFY
uniref:inositol-1,3,4-trisphosphate 5/6-kinase n=1 Tax=Physcomitrium patens TaxID=3218 RepID=A0A2K1IRQ2_PHYPA|nr:hypothetical protein PHYPA_026075 [Physcomitrium patens]